MSKSAMINAVLVLGLLAAGFATYQRVHDSALQAEHNLDREKLKTHYLERVAFLRSIPDEHAYQEELRPFFREYFSQVDELVKRYNLNPAFDDFLVDLKRRQQEKQEKKEGGPDTEAGRTLYDATQKIFVPLRQGTYSPMLTGADHGLRLDMMPGEVKEGAGGQVVFPMVLWGAQTELREDKPTRTQRVTALAGFDTVLKLFDSGGKFIGEMRGGDLSTRVDYPERFVSVFPPQMLLGNYKIDRVPAEAEKGQLTVEVTSRATWGSSQKATFSYSFPIKREWRLSPGEVWQGAEVSERPEEEINPPGPEKKKKK